MPDPERPNPLAGLGQPRPADPPVTTKVEGQVDTIQPKPDSLDNTREAPAALHETVVESKPEPHAPSADEKRELEKTRFQSPKVQSDENAGDDARSYTSMPRERLSIGKFQFEKGLLTLSDPKQIDEFETLLDKLPPRERHMVKTVSRSAADRLVAARPRAATQGFAGSELGRQQERLAGGAVVGTEAVEAHTDVAHAAGPEQFHKGVGAPNVADHGQNAVQEDGSTD